MNTMTRPYANSARVAILALALFGCTVSAPVLAASHCSSASIDEAFVLPDGSEFASGDLSVCLERQSSPVAALYETRVDGMPIGLYSSHFTAAGAAPAHPYFVFGRATDGRLHLRGFVHSGPDGAVLNAFGDPRVRIRIEIGDFYVHTATGPSPDGWVWIQARRG